MTDKKISQSNLKESINPEKKEEKLSDEKKVLPVTVKEDEIEVGIIEDNDDDLLSDEDEDLLVENDGDFFWVLQKVVWGVLKVILIGGFVSFIVWFIWFRGASNVEFLPEFISKEIIKLDDEKNILDEKIKKEEIVIPAQKEEIKKEKIEVVKKQPKIVLKDDLARYMYWVRQSQEFFALRMNHNAWGTTITQRSNYFERFVFDLKELITESTILRNQLSVKLNAYYKGVEESMEFVKYYELQLQEALKNMDYKQAPVLVNEKIKSQKQEMENRSLFLSNQYVLQIMETYDKSLRQVYHKATVNKQAIIQNIQVVKFDNDPFTRVLTPAEWNKR